MSDELLSNGEMRPEATCEQDCAPTSTCSVVRLTRKKMDSAAIEQAIAAIAAGDQVALTKLVKTKKQANWHRPDRAWCLLDEAVRRGSTSMVDWLLAKGANPNTLFKRDRPISQRNATEEGWYFSPFASSISDENSEIAALMIKAGASLDLPCDIDDEYGNTTCQDKIDDCELWPAIEAWLIAWSSPVVGTNASRGGPRL